MTTRELTLDDASRLAERYFDCNNANLNEKRVDCTHGWIFYGTKHSTYGVPGSTGARCIAINKVNARIYRVFPPSHRPAVQEQHELHLEEFERSGRISNTDNRTWRWIKLRLGEQYSDDDVRSAARLLSAATRLDEDSLDQLIRQLARTGSTSEMLRCRSEEHEEDCVHQLRELLPGAEVRHSMMRILVDKSDMRDRY